MIKVVLAVTNDIVTDNRLHKVAKTLKGNGFNPLIVGRQLKNSLPLTHLPIATCRLKILKDNGPLFYVFYNIQLFFFLLKTKFEVIVANDLDTLPACKLAAKLKNAELVFDSHELFTEVPELVGRDIVKGIWKRMERMFIPGTKYAYTVCQSIADVYKNEYKLDFEVVRNVGRFRFENELPQREANKKKKIIYQGVLNKGRGLELVIEAMRYLSDCELIIAGSGDIEDELKQLVEKLNLQEKCIFLGKVPYKELWNYTSTADLGFSLEEDLGLNYRYALPNKLFDYVQARIPVLVSDLPEMSALVEQFSIGEVVRERIPEKLAMQILDMLNDEKANQARFINLSIAARELCWEREQDKLIVLYRKVHDAVIHKSVRKRKL